MDPLTHALTGATVAWAVSGSRLGSRALWIGGAAALAPDLDVLIRSAGDPLLAIEHHRGFTHSLAFAPVGAAVVALLFGRRGWLAALAAWLSHALLDSATTYGTQLFWPFSRYRVGLDVISIIDPIFTLFMLAGVIAAVVECGSTAKRSCRFPLRQRRAAAGGGFGDEKAATRRRRTPQLTVLAIAVLWLALGFVQRERALAAQQRLASRRGERIERAAVFPTVGNTIVWRSLYETNGLLRMDRIRVPWLGAATFTSGPTVPRIASPHGTPRMRNDFARFAWFSGDWVAADPGDPTLLGDARYSIHADRYRPVWGIRLHRDRTEWVDRTRERLRRFR